MCVRVCPYFCVCVRVHVYACARAPVPAYVPACMPVCAGCGCAREHVCMCVGGGGVSGWVGGLVYE